MHIKTLIKASWIVPMEPKGVVLADHCIAIDEGKIVAILPQNELADITADEVFDLEGHIVFPGMVNAHSHVPMNLLRGMGADLSLMDWLQTKIWPAEGKLMSPEFCYEGALLAGQEMIQSGITCTNDHYFFPEDIARGLTEAGLKATVSGLVIGFPSAMAKNNDEYLACAESLVERFQGDSRVRVSVGPHAPYTVDDETLRRCAALSDKYNLPIHMHIDETAFEVSESLRLYGKRPVHRLHDLGIINERLISVHTVHPDDSEMDVLAKARASVAHCPASNLKLGSGFAPIATMMDRGINLAIGTDSVASNDKLDLLSEGRLAAMLGKAVANDTTKMKVADILYAMTMGGAKALGWQDRIGSIEPGKDADLVAVNLHDICTIPVTDPLAQLLYSAGREHITHVWTEGKNVVKTQHSVNCLHFDPKKSVEVAIKWQNKLK